MVESSVSDVSAPRQWW